MVARNVPRRKPSTVGVSSFFTFHFYDPFAADQPYSHQQPPRPPGIKWTDTTSIPPRPGSNDFLRWNIYSNVKRTGHYTLSLTLGVHSRCTPFLLFSSSTMISNYKTFAWSSFGWRCNRSIGGEDLSLFLTAKRSLIWDIRFCYFPFFELPSCFKIQASTQIWR